MSIDLFNASSLQGQIIANILTAKGLQFTPRSTAYPQNTNFLDEPTLIDNKRQVHGAMIIPWYLEQRYPAPPLFPNAAADTAVTQMLFRNLIHYDHEGMIEVDLSDFYRQLQSHAFLNGATPTILDIAVYTLAPETTFWIQYRTKVLANLGAKKTPEEDLLDEDDFYEDIA